MKRSLFLVILFLPCFIYAQKINGIVKNSGGKPLPFTSVTVKDTVNNWKETLITDLEGSFKITLPLVNHIYLFSFSHIGYEEYVIRVNPLDKPNLLIELLPSSKELVDVSIIGRKKIIERKTDRLILNVENNLNTIGLDGADVLSKTPMVRVEDNKVSLIGKQGVAVMVDNKLIRLTGSSLMDFLKSIQASNISKIEVITNPPAEYDAEGNSGLINIVTKKNKQPGFLLSLSQRVAKTTYYSTATNLNLNYNFKKALFFANLSGAVGANGPTTSINRFYNNQTWYQSNQTKEKSRYVNGSIGFDYNIGKTDKVGGSFNGNISYPDAITNSKTKIINNSNGSLDSILHNDGFGDKKFIGRAYNLHYSKTLDTLGSDLQFDADHFINGTNILNESHNYNTLNEVILTNNGINNINSGNQLSSKGYTLNLVFHLPTKKVKYTFGAKVSFLNSNNIVQFNQNVLSKSLQSTSYQNEFIYLENIQALFGSMSGSLGKLKYQLGLRSETTQTLGKSPSIEQTNTNSYIGIFPTFYAMYPISKKNVISVNYGRRIGRPNFSAFNPFRIYYSQFEYYTGNPALAPSFTNNFEISNTYDGIWSATVSYSKSKALPSTVQLISNGDNTIASTVGNFLEAQNYYLSNDISCTPFKWLETQVQLSVYYSITNSSSPVTRQRVSGSGSDFRISNAFDLDKNKIFSGNVDFTYQFPETSGIYRNYSYNYLDLALNCSLLKKNLQFSIAARDIFKSKYVSSYTEYNQIGVFTRANNDSRRFILTARYSLGNTKMQKGQSHLSSGSEQGRLGN